jgi:hypothetical protein
VTKNRIYLSNELFRFHSSLYDIATDFDIHYSHFRLVNLADLKMEMPLTMNDFKQKVSDQLETSQTYLIDQWLPRCIFIVEKHRDSIENRVSQAKHVIILIRNQVFI